MSLIDEALKRARLDAARQDAARQAGAAGAGAAGGAGGHRGGFASPWTHMEQSRGRRSDRHRIAAVAVVALSLLIGAAGVVLFLRASSRSSSSPGSSSQAGSSPASGSSPAPGGGAERAAGTRQPAVQNDGLVPADPRSEQSGPGAAA
ncbi:MAG TPA: hypothetical protein VN999_17945, partial [Thermoanaerobaculia bacterium]|nr:hypothetical protein [Thermoanaerobaculia bacterium]